MEVRRFGRRLSKAGAALMAAAIGGGLAMLSLADPAPVKAVRNIVFDTYLRAQPRPFDAEMPVRIVDIDDESLARLGQWPWPRTTVARLVDAIGARAPAAIGLDIVFSEPDRTSPERILPTLPPSPERDALARRIEAESYSNDKVLAETLGRHPVVAGIVLTQGAGRPPVRAGFAAAGDDPLPFLPKFDGAIAPLDVLQPGIKGFGALNWVPEYDLVVRRVPTLMAVGTQLVPSLAIEALRVAQEASTIIVKSSNASGEQAFGAETGIVSIKVGGIVVPTDSAGAVRVRYAGARPERRIAAWRLIEEDVPRDAFEGRIVLVGSSAAALADMRATPLDPVLPGVEVHAEVIEHALAGNRLARPDWAPGAEAVLVFLSALLAAATGYVLPPLTATGAGLLWNGAAFLGSWTLFSRADLLIDPALPSLAGLLAFAATSVARWRASDSEKKAVRNAFGHYLSPTLVERLSGAPEQLVLGGEQRTLTLLFSDVRGFTGLSETFKGDPQGLTQLMNRLLTPLTDAIIARDGTIDKYMGDAIMAFWNAPLDIPDHPVRACEAALAMRRALDALNAELRAEAAASGRPEAHVAIGIGLNTGECVVGNMGSNVRFDYSALGDAVNLASRLEGQTKAYGVNILVGAATEQHVRGRMALLEVDLVTVKGKSEPERVFALIGDGVMASQPSFTRLAAETGAMLAAYRAREWDKADAIARGLERMAFEYPLAAYLGMMRARVAAYRASPPPEGWDGAFVAESK